MKIYVVHGYTASPNSNWFPYLKDKPENERIEVIILDMPNSQEPKLTEWVSHIEKAIQNFDENTIFVGHSLGCVTILNYLKKCQFKKIKGLFLISGFVESTPIPKLSEFIQPVIDYEEIKSLAENIITISAKDDDIVPYEYSEMMAEKLNSKFILLNEGKHFIDRDKFIKFPYLINEIKKILE